MAENEEKKEGSMKKTLMLVAAGVLAAVAVMWFVVMPMVLLADAEEEDPAAKEPHGVVMELEPVTVNLSGASYLKVGVALHFEESSEEGYGGSGPSGAKALDVLIDEFSGDDVNKVLVERAAYRESVQKKISKAYHGEVGAVYFTDYVVQ